MYKHKNTKQVYVQKSCTVHIFPEISTRVTYQQMIQVLPILHHLSIQTKPCHWNTSASQQARMVAPCKTASNCLFIAIFRGCFLAQIFTDASRCMLELHHPRIRKDAEPHRKQSTHQIDRIQQEPLPSFRLLVFICCLGKGAQNGRTKIGRFF